MAGRRRRGRGDRHRRVAGVVPGDAVGIEAAHTEDGVERAAALPAADRQRGPAHRRHDEDVDVVEDRVDAGDLAGTVGHRLLVEVFTSRTEPVTPFSVSVSSVG